MRYDKCESPKKPRGPTPRMYAAARRHIEAERAKYPLFPDLVNDKPEERVSRNQANLQVNCQAMRDRHPASWRRGRRALFSLPVERRHALLDEWSNHRWLPGSPEYFLDFLRRKGVDL